MATSRRNDQLMRCETTLTMPGEARPWPGDRFWGTQVHVGKSSWFYRALPASRLTPRRICLPDIFSFFFPLSWCGFSASRSGLPSRLPVPVRVLVRVVGRDSRPGVQCCVTWILGRVVPGNRECKGRFWCLVTALQHLHTTRYKKESEICTDPYKRMRENREK